MPAGVEGATAVHASEVGVPGGVQDSVGAVVLQDGVARAAAVAAGDADVVREGVDGRGWRVGRRSPRVTLTWTRNHLHMREDMEDMTTSSLQKTSNYRAIRMSLSTGKWNLTRTVWNMMMLRR